MAKQLGIIQYSGKLGQTVGMKKSDVQRANSIRVRVNPSNPRTKAQAEQRMKINTALKIYRAAQPVLSRAFENKKYGNQSRLYFMSLLMSKNFEASGNWLPYVPKGDVRPIPGQIPMSVGTISVDTTVYSWVVGGPSFKMFEATLAEQATTKGKAFQLLLDNVPGLQNGDQITAVLVTYVNDSNGNPVYRWVYDSIVVDVNSDEPVDGMDYDEPQFMMKGERGVIRFGYETRDLTGHDGYAAAAIIVSRDKDAAQGAAGLRSSSVMYCNTIITDAFHTEGAKTAAIASYMSPRNSNGNNWPYDSGVSVIVTPETPAVVAYGNIRRWSGGTEKFQKFAVAKLADGTGRGYKSVSGSVLEWDEEQQKFKIMHWSTTDDERTPATDEILAYINESTPHAAEPFTNLVCTGWLSIPDSELGEEDPVVPRP